MSPFMSVPSAKKPFDLRQMADFSIPSSNNQNDAVQTLLRNYTL